MDKADDKTAASPHEDLLTEIVQTMLSDPAVVEKLTSEARDSLQSILLNGQLSPSDLIAAANKHGEVE